MLELGIKLLASYLLGSLLGALIVGRLAGGVDIRTVGSHNAGGTNAFRTQGAWFALAVMIIDIGKGVLAAGVIPYLDVPGLPENGPGVEWVAAGCAVAAVLGHVYPVFYGFRGGKGAATLIGVLLALMPDALIPVLAIWFLVVMVSGFVGLATICAALVAPLYVALLRPAPFALSLLAFAVTMALFVVFTHRSNIRRMLAGEEDRRRGLMLLRRGRGQ